MIQKIRVEGGRPLIGECTVPGDKSISHRAVLFGALSEGTSEVRGFLDGGDCLSTVSVMRGLGITVEQRSRTELTVIGRGLEGFVEPNDVLDCGNSGTTIRLLAGLLSGQRFASFLSGTAQVRRRPMDRVVSPLSQMGADIIGRGGGRYAPLALRGLSGQARLRGIEYILPVASAQVKSCLLLAGLYADEPVVVREPGPGRDHTERMLSAMGVSIKSVAGTIQLERPKHKLSPFRLEVPGDMSSAAFLLVAASIAEKSRLRIRNVGLNPTRTGLLDGLLRMGGSIRVENPREEGGEPIGDLSIEPTALHGETFGGEQVVRMIDELPVLAVLATQATGETVVRDASELRVKETDRIATTVAELRKLGANIEPLPDGFRVEGPTRLRGATVQSHGDHRLAMALAVAGLVAEGTTVVTDADVTADSFPGFEQTLSDVGAQLTVE